MSVFKHILFFLCSFVFLSCQKQDSTLFYVKEFSNYSNYAIYRDSLVFEKRHLINNPHEDLRVFTDTLKFWSDSNNPLSLFKGKTKVIKYLFYHRKNKGVFQDEIGESYKESGGLWSSYFGDKRNPLYAEIEWKYYEEKNEIRRIISIVKNNNERFELDRIYLKLNKYVK